MPRYEATLSLIGTVGAPGVSSTTDPNTGLYSIGADNIGIALGGVLRADFGGTYGVPTTLTLLANTATQGALALKRTSATQSVSLFTVRDENNVTLMSIFSDGRISTPSGSVAFPGLHIGTADNDNGLYSIGADNWGASVGGAKILDLKNAAGTLQMGFFGAAPVNRPAGIADANVAHSVSGVGTVSVATLEAALNALGAKINSLISQQETLGLIATV